MYCEDFPLGLILHVCVWEFKKIFKDRNLGDFVVICQLIKLRNITQMKRKLLCTEGQS